jgi:hypothetical protein
MGKVRKRLPDYSGSFTYLRIQKIYLSIAYLDGHTMAPTRRAPAPKVHRQRQFVTAAPRRKRKLDVGHSHEGSPARVIARRLVMAARQASEVAVSRGKTGPRASYMKIRKITF